MIFPKNNEAIISGNTIKKLKLTKEEESFLIVSLVKLLELKITDFKNWSKSQEDIDDNTEENDDEV